MFKLSWMLLCSCIGMCLACLCRWGLETELWALLPVVIEINFLHSTYVLSNLPLGQTFYSITNLTRHDLLTDNIVKITQNVLVRCLVIVSNHNVRLTGHFQKLVVQCRMTS